MPNDNRPPLEAFVHRALRELPAARAPASLEARVSAALQARQRLPRWQAGWRAWPVVPRVAVLAAAGAAVLLAAWMFLVGAHSVETFAWSAWIETHAPGLATLGSVCSSLVDALALCLRLFQPWLLAVAALMACAYAALLALGSGLYRSIIANR